MRPTHRFRALAARLGFGPRRPIRRNARARLVVAELEDRTVPYGNQPVPVDPLGGSQFFTSVAADAQGNYVVAYDGWDWDAGGPDRNVYARRIDPAGNPVGDPIPVNTVTTGEQLPGGVAMAADGRFVVVWHSDQPGADGTEVYARRFNADGTPLDAQEFRVNQLAADVQWYPTVAMAPDGTFLVTWSDYGRDTSGQPQAYARLFS